MKRSLIAALALGLVSTFGLIGCGGDESKVTSEKTVETPEGSTTATSETKIETSGDNPPPVSTDTPTTPTPE